MMKIYAIEIIFSNPMTAPSYLPSQFSKKGWSGLTSDNSDRALGIWNNFNGIIFYHHFDVKNGFKSPSEFFVDCYIVSDMYNVHVGL